VVTGDFAGLTKENDRLRGVVAELEKAVAKASKELEAQGTRIKELEAKQ
jgi:hypothetical protein